MYHHQELHLRFFIFYKASQIFFHHQTCKDLEDFSQIPTCCLGQHQRLHSHPLMDDVLPLHQLHLLYQLLLLQGQLLKRRRRLLLVAVLKDMRLLDQVQLKLLLQLLHGLFYLLLAQLHQLVLLKKIIFHTWRRL